MIEEMAMQHARRALTEEWIAVFTALIEGEEQTMKTLPNRNPDIDTTIRLRTPYSGACPHSGYPLPGSWLEVVYTPGTVILELSAIADHIPNYATEAIDVETVAQRLATAAAAALGVSVTVNAYYILRDGIELWATCRA